VFKLYHEDLAHEAKHEDGKEHHGYTVKLDMGNFVMGVELKNEEVIYAESSQNHDISGHKEEGKDEHGAEAEDWEGQHYLFPI
jgi:hypothetical protein